ncbi:MAG: hypothetical protein PGN13_13385 [Patulibacter minatonensis]
MTFALAASSSSDASVWSDLGSVVVYGLIAGIGIAVLFSVALRGLILASTARREGNGGAALVWGGVGFVGVLACVAVVGLGIVTMLHR